jgi:hypothetical protein
MPNAFEKAKAEAMSKDAFQRAKSEAMQKDAMHEKVLAQPPRDRVAEQKSAMLGRILQQESGVPNTKYPVTQDDIDEAKRLAVEDPESFKKYANNMAMDHQDVLRVLRGSGVVNDAESAITAFGQGASLGLSDEASNAFQAPISAIQNGTTKEDPADKARADLTRDISVGSAEEHPVVSFLGNAATAIPTAIAAGPGVIAQGLVGGAIGGTNAAGQSEGNARDRAIAFVKTAPLSALFSAVGAGLANKLTSGSALASSDWETIAQAGEKWANRGKDAALRYTYKGTNPIAESAHEGMPSNSGLKNMSEDVAASTFEDLPQSAIIPNGRAQMQASVDNRQAIGRQMDELAKNTSIPFPEAKQKLAELVEKTRINAPDAYLAVKQQADGILEFMRTANPGASEVAVSQGGTAVTSKPMMPDVPMTAVRRRVVDLGKQVEKSTTPELGMPEAHKALKEFSENYTPELADASASYRVAKGVQQSAENRMGAQAAEATKAIGPNIETAAARGAFAGLGDVVDKAVARTSNSVSRRMYNALAKNINEAGGNESLAVGNQVIPMWKAQNWARMLEKIQGSPDESVMMYAFKGANPDFAAFMAQKLNEE